MPVDISHKDRPISEIAKYFEGPIKNIQGFHIYSGTEKQIAQNFKKTFDQICKNVKALLSDIMSSNELDMMENGVLKEWEQNIQTLKDNFQKMQDDLTEELRGDEKKGKEDRSLSYGTEVQKQFARFNKLLGFVQERIALYSQAGEVRKVEEPKEEAWKEYNKQKKIEEENRKKLEAEQRAAEERRIKLEAEKKKAAEEKERQEYDTDKQLTSSDVSDLAKKLKNYEKSMRDTNKSWFTKQSGEFEALCNCLTVLNKQLDDCDGRITGSNAEKIGRTLVALRVAQNNYIKHCLNVPKSAGNKVRNQRIALSGEFTSYCVDLENKCPFLKKVEKGVLKRKEKEPLQDICMETAARGKQIKKNPEVAPPVL